MHPEIADKIPKTQQAIAVIWPAFIVAIVATGLFFAAFDPQDLNPFNLDTDISPQAAYSIGFLIFWILAILSSYGTLYFCVSNHRLRQQKDLDSGVSKS